MKNNILTRKNFFHLQSLIFKCCQEIDKSSIKKYLQKLTFIKKYDFLRTINKAQHCSWKMQLRSKDLCKAMLSLKIDELFSEEFKNDAFHRGDYWRKVCSQLSSFKRS